MGDKAVVNPKLFKKIDVEEFNKDQIRREQHPDHTHPNEGIRDAEASVRVLDKNGNGVVDEGDKFVNIETNRFIEGTEKSHFLQRICDQYQPNSTKFVETPEAMAIRKKNDVKIFFDKSGVYMNNEYLLLPGGIQMSSGGNFEEGLDGCNYNFAGMTLDAGRNDHELKLIYTDATGDHVAYLDLKKVSIEEVS